MKLKYVAGVVLAMAEQVASAGGYYCVPIPGTLLMPIPYIIVMIGNWPANTGKPADITLGNLVDYSPLKVRTSVTLAVNPGPTFFLKKFDVQNDRIDTNGFIPPLSPCINTFEYDADAIFHDSFDVVYP